MNVTTLELMVNMFIIIFSPQGNVTVPSNQNPQNRLGWISLYDYQVLYHSLCCHLLLCRHEDGTIRFWDASGVCLKPLYKLSTVNVFVTDADHNDNLNQSAEDEWPPLRKVHGCALALKCGVSVSKVNSNGF